MPKAIQAAIGIFIFYAGLISGMLWSNHNAPPTRIPCGSALSTQTEDDQCVIVPLSAVSER